MTFVIGLTGSVGMGKSTTAGFFADEGVPVWDADSAVHRLYAPGGAAVAPVSAAFPAALRDGAIDRSVLKQLIAEDPGVLKRLEGIVHPLVAADRARFLADHPRGPVVLDVPLLFETGLDRDCDLTVTVTAPPDIQRDRVLARPGMTEAQFQLILARQLPDAEKRARADHVIETLTLDDTRTRVRQIVEDIRKTYPDA
ncbi:MAG: dephospho-CoA kinase [Rubellimicrobium sp.]|nr:dephospho-CoA kinase [Rubellimicrobium sp.]